MSPPKSDPIGLLFVCLGNICRSPAFAAVMEKLIRERGLEERIFVDSMGLTTHYLQRPVDVRIRGAAEKANVPINHYAQLLRPSDLQRFDWIFAVDTEVQGLLQSYATTPAEREKILLATAFSKKHLNEEILDPYSNGEEAFDRVIAIAFDACQGILDHICNDQQIN